MCRPVFLTEQTIRFCPALDHFSPEKMPSAAKNAENTAVFEIILLAFILKASVFKPKASVFKVKASIFKPKILAFKPKASKIISNTAVDFSFSPTNKNPFKLLLI
jgi:hypothetical protein